ncbi:DUF1353 domain-containing protein [Psychrobacter sp. 1176_08]|uniref:DUF1353 domain-containing protein n=1 Tax=Psychrobacter sp. 1176_08 TaxID=2604452 RepID=UPI004062838D
MNSNFITGEVILFPEGCQNTGDGICHLKGKLSFVSPRNGMVWETKEWKNPSMLWTKGENPEGTTDGTTLPIMARPFLGRRYDLSYLKASIIHDHYCYEKGQIRTWQDTHLMYYDALIALKVSKTRAKLMYFAVYSFGPKWKIEETMFQTEMLSPRFSSAVAADSSEFESLLPTKARPAWKKDLSRAKATSIRTKTKKEDYDSNKFNEQFSKIESKLESNPEMTLEEIEVMARNLDPHNFLFE